MKYFYSDVNDPFSDISKEGDLGDILKSFVDLSKENGSFLGLINDNGLILQFMCEGEDEFIADIPKIESNGSFQKNLNFKMCIDLIEDFYNEILIDTNDFRFVSF